MMAVRFVNMISELILLFLCIVAINGRDLPPKVFNVINYGAIADGETDNTQAFLEAWKNACEYEGKGRVWVPRGTFVLGSVSFLGNCKSTMAFLVKGVLKAPTDSDSRNFFTDTWIGFRYVDNLTVAGGGVLDGQGHSAWRYNDCQINHNCKPLPTTMRFDFVSHARVFNLHSINSKNSHVNIFACTNITFSHIELRAPGDSPNTDGFHMGLSKQIRIRHSIIATGDDCVSMVSGSRDIDVFNVTCGPGHGISIGSLGRSHEAEFVRGIRVRNCTFVGSDNGVRIKTWSPSSSSVASKILFEDIVMQGSKNPIVIDQNYCASPHCLIQGDSSSGVQIEDVMFKNIRGVSSSKVALNLQCSGMVPCKNVTLVDINLAYNGPGGRAMALCSHVIGSASGKLVPSGCV